MVCLPRVSYREATLRTRLVSGCPILDSVGLRLLLPSQLRLVVSLTIFLEWNVILLYILGSSFNCDPPLEVAVVAAYHPLRGR